MYKHRRTGKVTTSLKHNVSYIGESIETKVNRIVNNNEPIKDGAPLIYTDRKEGVQPAYDIRADRWDIANDAMEAVNKDKVAQRMARMEVVRDEPKKDSGAEPIASTESK